MEKRKKDVILFHFVNFENSIINRGFVFLSLKTRITITSMGRVLSRAVSSMGRVLSRAISKKLNITYL
jgi:hypothetical protein